MMRIGLFLATNFAVVLLASITLKLLGVDAYLAQSGSNMNLTSMLVFCAVAGMAGSFISLLMSKFMAKRSARVQLIEQPQNSRERWLLETVEKQARQAGIGMPEVGIFPARQSNAFATGWNKNKALVAVSEGLLHNMTQDEVEAVLGHEIAHIANGDMITLTLLQGIVNTFVMFFARIIGSIIDKAIFKQRHGRGFGYYAIVFVCEMVLGLLASAIVMWFSRYREYRADIGGAELSNNQSMINALKALQREFGQPNELPASISAFGISASGLSGLKRKLLSSHPPLELRIAALQNRKA